MNFLSLSNMYENFHHNLEKKLQEIFIIIWKRMPSWVFLIFSIRYLYFAGLILINSKFKTVKCFNGNNFSIFARQGYIIQLKLELSSTPRFLVCCIASYWNPKKWLEALWQHIETRGADRSSILIRLGRIIINNLIKVSF